MLYICIVFYSHTLWGVCHLFMTQVPDPLVLTEFVNEHFISIFVKKITLYLVQPIIDRTNFHPDWKLILYFKVKCLVIMVLIFYFMFTLGQKAVIEWEGVATYLSVNIYAKSKNLHIWLVTDHILGYLYLYLWARWIRL